MNSEDDLGSIPLVNDNDLESKLARLNQKVQKQKRSVLKKGGNTTSLHGNEKYGKSQQGGGGVNKFEKSDSGSGKSRFNNLSFGNGSDKGKFNSSLNGKRKGNWSDTNQNSQYAKKRAKENPASFDKNVKTEKTDWKQMKLEQKQLKEKRKRSKGVELYELSKEVKLMWEELRQETCPKNTRKRLSNQVYNMIKPFLKKIVFAHDMVRVVECLLAHGGPEIRDSIFNELKDEILSLSKNKYAHFFVLKLLKYGSKAQRSFIMAAFDGHVIELLKNQFSMSVVELAYNDYANSLQRSRITQELYGPEFKVFKDESCKNLDQLLEKSPAKRDSILKNMKENLLKILPKGPWKATMMHTLMYEYLSHCDSESRCEFIDLVKNDLVNILHTRDGSRVAMACLWHGSAKDRKHIIKSFKGFVGKIAREEHGHLILLSMFDCVDDTTLVSKAILGELLEDGDDALGDLILDKHGRKVVLYLIAPRDPAFFHPQFTKILEQGDGNVFSKKDAAVRREELLNFVTEKLLEKVCANFKDYVQNNSCLVAVLAILNLNLRTKVDLTSAYENISKILCDATVPENTNFVICLKNLITNDSKRDESTVKFSGILVDTLKHNQNVVEHWVGQNHMCSIFTTMITLKTVEERKILALLKPFKAAIKENQSQGARNLEECLKTCSFL